MKIGKGGIHFYDQPPEHSGMGSIHHFGIQTDNLQEDCARLVAMGVQFGREVTHRGYWRYVMVPAPDDILIEYFQVDREKLPPELRDYFQ